MRMKLQVLANGVLKFILNITFSLIHICHPKARKFSETIVMGTVI